MTSIQRHFSDRYTCSYACRLKKLDLQSGSQAIDISWGSLTCPSKHRHGTNHPFYGSSEKPTHFSCLLRCAWGYGGPICILNPWVPTGSNKKEKKTQIYSNSYKITWLSFTVTVQKHQSYSANSRQSVEELLPISLGCLSADRWSAIHL